MKFPVAYTFEIWLTWKIYMNMGKPRKSTKELSEINKKNATNHKSLDLMGNLQTHHFKAPFILQLDLFSQS